MAIKEKDLLAAIARLKEANAFQQKAVERMSLDEFRKMYEPTVSADAVEQGSVKVLEEQRKGVATPAPTQQVTNINNVSEEIHNVSNELGGVKERIETVSKSVNDKTTDGLYKESSKQTEQGEETKEYQKEQLEALLKLGKSFDTFKSPLENLASKLQAYSPANIKETLLSKMNIKIPGMGGIFDKAIAREKFVKTEKMLGSTKSKSEIARDFQSYNEQSKIIQKNEKTISKIKGELPDASEQQLMRIPEYAEAKQASESAAKESGKFTVKSSIMQPTNEEVGSTTKIRKHVEERTPAGIERAVNPTRKDAASLATAEETAEENKLFEEQTDLLREIAENTAAFNPESQKGGRAVGGIGRTPTKKAGMGFADKLERIGGTMVGAAKGVAAIGGSLIVLTLGLKAIGTIDLESVLKATIALGALIGVSKLMGSSVASMTKGALGIAALGGAMWVASKGFEAFANIDWETLTKAGIAIGGLAVGAMAIGGAAAPILLGALAIAGLGAAVWVLGEGLQAVGEAVDSFVGSIERLGEIDGGNLIEVGAGLAAVAAGMVAFGAANAVAGVTNLVGGFLGAITPGKTPVEQLLEIAEAGPNIQAAGTGIQSFAEGLTKFSAVDKEKLSIIKDLPNDKIIALGVAIGKATPTAANAVYTASAENAGVGIVGGSGTTNNVVAPTTVNNTTNQVNNYKPDVRNQDSSFKRMLDSRYVPV